MSALPCVCEGNWRLILHEYRPFFGRHYIGVEGKDSGKEFVFIGLMDGEDDYYYVMWSKADGFRLLTCVGSIEGNGYKITDKYSPAYEPPCED